ncbi:hypothetical protein BG015_000072, partial [Linnemannia schmuckeri]
YGLGDKLTREGVDVVFDELEDLLHGLVLGWIRCVSIRWMTIKVFAQNKENTPQILQPMHDRRIALDVGEWNGD